MIHRKCVNAAGILGITLATKDNEVLVALCIVTPHSLPDSPTLIFGCEMFSPKLLRLGAAKWSCRYSTSALRNVRVAALEDVLEDFKKPLHLLNYSGSRVLELSRVDSGNIVTEGILGSLQYRFDIMRDIPTIEAVIVASAHPNLFSNGLELKHLDDKNQRKEYISRAHEASSTFGDLNKETIALYSGDVDACTFGLFATAKYRLGTDSTSFQMKDLLEGRLPLGGSIAHHLAHCTEKGYAVSTLFLPNIIAVLIARFFFLFLVSILTLYIPCFFFFFFSWHDTWASVADLYLLRIYMNSAWCRT